MKKFTVIGFWSDESEPWMEWGEGFTPEEGMRDAIEGSMKENEWDEDMLGNLVIVDVIEGHQKGVLGNIDLLSAKNVIGGRG